MKNLIYKSIYPVILFSAFCITLSPAFKSLSLILLLLVLLINKLVNKNKTYFSQMLNLKNPLLWLVLLYLLHCIGMIYSTDLNYGFVDLLIKLPFLLLPIAAALVPKRIVTKKNLWNMFLSFAIGLIFTQLYCLTGAILWGFNDGVLDIREILYTKLAIGYHPTYLSLYTCFAFMMFYQMPWKKSHALKLILMSWLAIFNVLLSSRIGILAMVLICAVILFKEVFFEKRYIKALSYLTVCLVFALSFLVVQEFNNRYANIVAKTKISENKERKITDSVSQRSFIYTNIVEMIMKEPILGVGTGDVKTELEKFYNEKQVDFGLYLNAHNQFFQIAIAIGIVGLICFLIMLFMLSLDFWNKDKLIYLLSIAVLVLIMMTESVFERQQGVHFLPFILYG